MKDLTPGALWMQLIDEGLGVDPGDIVVVFEVCISPCSPRKVLGEAMDTTANFFFAPKAALFTSAAPVMAICAHRTPSRRRRAPQSRFLILICSHPLPVVLLIDLDGT